MPGSPKPVIDPRFGPAWTPPIQALQAQKQQALGLNAGATQGNIPDQWGNITQLSGSNLNQTVTIGASHGVAGVQVGTGIPSGTSGLAVQSGPAITTITLTKGSTAATVGTVIGAALSPGQVIGAADVSDPSSGTPTPAITPGTTIDAISGTSVTLSEPAAESGVGLYCAAAKFLLQQDTGWVSLTLSSGITPVSARFTPTARLIGDMVFLRGAANAAGDVSTGTPIGTLPALMWPSFLTNTLITAGNPTLMNISTSGVLTLVSTWNHLFSAEFGGASYAL